MKFIDYYQITNDEIIPGRITGNQPESTHVLREMAEKISSAYFMLKLKPGNVSMKKEEVFHWVDFMKRNNASLSYADYFEINATSKTLIPTIDYHEGCIRDDFNFGPLVLIKYTLLKKYLANAPETYKFAGWYDFRLFLSREGTIMKYPEQVGIHDETDFRLSGEKQFDYVDPRNRERQIEMEKAATLHLEKIGARLYPPFKTVDVSEGDFNTEATVIVPVLNRDKTIADAILSVLKQKTTFPFNLIVVNNHSTDRTTEIINQSNDIRVIHHIPERNDLGIGGCWNEGIKHPACGRFAIQLDSDDLYSDQNTLQKIVDKFYEEKCAMIIGSYQMVNFDLNPIPPGLIDHREWTNNNGPNNALRINGLGAPRAFYTPIIREIGFPNVSYGEDYAVALAISRTFKIGRIYEPLYLCRRWHDNTDASLGIEKINAHNEYKDLLRKKEIQTRIKLIRSVL
ncbi:MAG: glycosyltransferase family 2 protein [Prolixibacteraceae bacterium]|nr:glycosyltransferase family 2 protein [Prolixibacteraceae bacterium]